MIPDFDITKPMSPEQDAALAASVLRRFQTGDGALTTGDAGRIVEAIEQLYARAFPEGLSMVITSKAELPWRCYFCDETFEDKRAAALHFGADEECTPACQIKGSEGGLLKALRDTEEELFKATCRLHDESGEVLRTWAAVGSRHHAAMISAEETGYQRGLRDSSVADGFTYAVQHNPNCPKPFLVRLCGKWGQIDLLAADQTRDILGYGLSFLEAFAQAKIALEGRA